MPPTSIPRFLLPRGLPIWRPLQSPSSIRSASTKAKGANAKPKPLVLEKPTKFTPPSHPQRLRKEAPRYPGPALNEEEKARQASKKYPRMLPPENTLSGKFIRSRAIHIWISLSTLSVLAVFVWTVNFKRSSPYSDLLPTWSSLLSTPFLTIRQFFDVLKMTQDQITRETAERRRQKVEDVAKRGAYRKAHGMDTEEGFGGWVPKTDGQLLGPGIPIEIKDLGAVDVSAENAAVAEGQVEVRREKKVVKKWFGIW